MKIKIIQLSDGCCLSLFDTCMYMCVPRPHNSKGAFYVEVKALQKGMTLTKN